MQVWEQLTNQEILNTLEAELAKTASELRDLEVTVAKSRNRVRFALTAIHHMKNADMENK